MTAKPQAFKPQAKKSPEEVLGAGKNPPAGGRRPPRLNKNLILIFLVSVIGLFLLVTQLALPLISSRKAKTEDALEIRRQNFTDYSRLVGDEAGAAQEAAKDAAAKEKPAGLSDDELLASLPPVSYYRDYDEAQPSRPSYAAAAAGRRSRGEEWPSTLRDSLQGKVIAGIKGLTPTRDSYLPHPPPREAGGGEREGPRGPLPYPAAAALEAMAAGNAASLAAGRTKYEKQNDQAGKKEFFEDKRFDGAGQGSWLPLNTVWTGTIFEALLLGEINTDLPGDTAAVVSKNIYSSQNGDYLLIPQGSRLIGAYNSSISYGQSRVQVAWHTLIRPDGYEVSLGNMAGADAKGASGLKGWVNDHFGKKLLGLAMVSALSIGNMEMKNTVGKLDNEYITQLWADDRSVINGFAEDVINKTMNVQPTIIIRGGTKINIVVNANLTLPPCKTYPVTQNYRRD